MSAVDGSSCHEQLPVSLSEESHSVPMHASCKKHVVASPSQGRRQQPLLSEAGLRKVRLVSELPQPRLCHLVQLELSLSALFTVRHRPRLDRFSVPSP